MLGTRSRVARTASRISAKEQRQLKPPRKRTYEDYAQDEHTTTTNNSRAKKYHTETGEKRLKAFRKKAPQSFLLKLERVQSQRMIVMGRTRSGTGASLQEDVDVVGSTGNVYTVTIGALPSCTCPDHQNGNECKHKVYVLHTVLKSPYHLQYQRAFLADELQTIFSKAPPIPSEVGDETARDGKRKPVDGECPICYVEMNEKSDELVWCRASCGNNVHKSCFEQWAASQRGETVRCVYCRGDWETDPSELKDIKARAARNADGYINVAEHFGLSQDRDYSSYYQPWVRRRFGYG